jgi:hsp70-interacting protein
MFVLFILSLVLFCSEEDRKWFMEAMQANTVDVVQRMKEITQVMKTPEDILESQGVTPENIEGIVWSLLILPESIHRCTDKRPNLVL